MAANTTNAQCLRSAGLGQSFDQYVNNCRTNADTMMARRIFPNSGIFKDTFQYLRAQFDDILTTGDSMNALMNLSGSTVSGTDQQIRQLQEKKNSLTAEISKYRRISESADRSFIDDVMNGAPKEQLTPTLQDVTLLLFWFGWLTMIITIVFVRWASPGGGWKSGIFTLALVLLVTLCVYAVVVKIA